MPLHTVLFEPVLFKSSYISNLYGKRILVSFFSVIFTIGALVMGIANSKEILLVGRLIVGMGIGLSSMSVPMYISEASPPHLRGLLVSSNILIVTFGQFVAACVCGAFSQTDKGKSI